MPGSTTKTCVSCRASIGVASKKCKACGGAQPYKVLKQKRLEKAKQRIKQSPHARKSNAIKSKDAAYVHLHNLQAAGYVPVLLLGKKKGSKMAAELLTLSENPSPEEQMTHESMRSEFENFLNVYCSGGTDGTHCAPATCSSTVSPPVSTQLNPHQSSPASFISTTVATSASTVTSNTSRTSNESTNPASTSDLLDSSSIPSTSEETGKEAVPAVRAFKQVGQRPDGGVADASDVPIVTNTRTTQCLDKVLSFHDILSESFFQEMDSLVVCKPPCEVTAEMDVFIHQSPTCSVDLEPGYPMISHDVNLKCTVSDDVDKLMLDPCSDVKDPSSKTEEDVLQHVPDLCSTPLDLTLDFETWDTHNPTELISLGSSVSDVVEVPSVDAQGFEDSSEWGL